MIDGFILKEKCTH